MTEKWNIKKDIKHIKLEPIDKMTFAKTEYNIYGGSEFKGNIRRLDLKYYYPSSIEKLRQQLITEIKEMNIDTVAKYYLIDRVINSLFGEVK